MLNWCFSEMHIQQSRKRQETLFIFSLDAFRPIFKMVEIHPHVSVLPLTFLTTESDRLVDLCCVCVCVCAVAVHW